MVSQQANTNYDQEITLLCDIDVYVQGLRQWATQNKVSPYKLAIACDLSASTLQHMYTEKWNPTLATLKTIEIYKFHCELPPIRDTQLPLDFGINLE